MTYGDLYDQIPLAWGIMAGIVGIVLLIALLIWRRKHPL